MSRWDENRRSFLFAISWVGLGSALPLFAFPADLQGLVLAAGDGEHLIHFRDGGDVFIKVSPATGCRALAWGTQQVMRGTGIPTHRHTQMEEFFFVLEGSGTFRLNDVAHPIERGTTISIPKNSWHGFLNPDHELLLLWMVTPPGLEVFFRETCSPPGAPRKRLSREQVHEIALKCGTEFR
jgi:quercetin dioxygenase-like cupin family protein